MQDQQDKIEAVQRMQSFIEQNLYENITLTGLAQVSLFSPWYSHRLFSEITGLTPAEYIRRLRLTKAVLRLRDYKCRVTDVAFETGFGSVDGFQRAFYREFGCNPREYASSPVPLYLFTPYGVKFKTPERRTDMENAKNVFVQVIEKPARKVIIKRGSKADNYWDYCEEVGCDVWGLLRSIRSISGEPVCLWLPAAYRTADTSVYVQGVEVETGYDGPVPEGFDVIALPAAKYLMFQGEPFEEECYCQAIEQVQDSMKKYDPSILGLSWDDSNPRIQLEPVGTRGYIELAAVK